MDFAISPRAEELRSQLQDFIDTSVAPATPVYIEQVRESGDPHFHPPVMEELKAQARTRGLWNLFMPNDTFGAGLSNVDYAPLCELMGRNLLTAEATNCAAPDTGNMELLAEFGTAAQHDEWLVPLLEGEIRSCFAMTEPWVASSDATNIQSRIERDGDHYIVNAHKWWTSGAASSQCTFAILMGVSDPDADRHRRHSMVLVPFDAPGVSVVRTLPVFGHDAGGGHCETLFENVRIPKEYLLGEEGGGFAIAQARLGPGRIHHCMRWIGICERVFDTMCRHITRRKIDADKTLATRQIAQAWVAEARAEIDASRLMVLHAADTIDRAGASAAREEVSLIKFFVAGMLQRVLDRAIQVHGALGMTDDTPLAYWYRHERAARIYDGPDEVHKSVVAKRILRGYGLEVKG